MAGVVRRGRGCSLTHPLLRIVGRPAHSGEIRCPSRSFARPRPDQGTLSLKAALEELGFTKCYHMVEVFTRKDDAQTWDTALSGEPVDWDRLFAGYRATVDLPSCLFYRGGIRSTPRRRLSSQCARDPDRWYDGAHQTIYFARTAFPRWATVFNPRMRTFHRMVDRMWERLFHGRFEGPGRGH